MTIPPLLAVEPGLAIYVKHLPILLVAISLVYSATRYDNWGQIFGEAVRWGAKLFFFLLAVGVVIYVVMIIPPFWS